MTYLNGPSIPPQLGGFYDLRAGLQCFIEAEVDIYGDKYFRGWLLPPASGVILWYAGGYYAPGRNKHELDIMREAL